MVATILRLKFRVLGNTLTRSPWRMVGFVFGILGGLWLLVLVVSGLVALRVFADVEATRAALVIAGTALTLGWLVGPIIAAGMDNTVDALHLAPLPLSRVQVMQVLTATGLTGVPGIITTVAALATVIAWSRTPAAAIVAVPCALIGVALCVIACRLLGSAARGGRRWQEIIGTIVLFVLILSGPIFTGVAALLTSTADLVAKISALTDVLAWTPVAAIWAVPADVIAGDWLVALARVAIALATLALLWIVWGRTLERGQTAPARKVKRAAKAGALGLFGSMPTGPLGATWARSLTFWLRDPRYMRQLIVLPLFPVLMIFTSGVHGLPFALSGVLAAFVMCTALYTDVSYDGTAFASVLTTGITGRADRAGRLLAAACIVTPLIVLLTVVPPIIAGRATIIPVTLGAGIGALFIGLGVSSVSSALMVMPVAAPGDNPFKTVPGQTFLNGLAVFAVIGATLLLSVPVAVPAIIALVLGSTLLGWVTLAVGIVWGPVVAWLGVIIGGRAFDRNGPTLLARIRAFPTS